MRAWGLSLAVAVVSASTFAAGLHQGESLDVDCTRTSPEATRCVVTSRRGLWAFVEVSTREVLLSNEMSVEWAEHSSRSGSYQTLSAAAPGERDRSITSSRSCSLKPVGQALEAHARDPSAPALHVHVAGYLGAVFLLALAGVFLAGAMLLPGIGRSAKTEPTAVDAPEPLRGKTLLNVAALLEANDGDPAWAAEVDKRVSPASAAREAAAGEEERFRASARARRAAARRWLRHLFPGATAAKVDAAWLRAEALDAATTRWARKEYRYPGTEADVPPDPRLVCPGFAEDVYRYVSNYVMTTLR